MTETKTEMKYHTNTRWRRYVAHPHYAVGLGIFTIVSAMLVWWFMLSTFESHELDKLLLGETVLMVEIALACKKAIDEGGHFPVRYIMLFVFTALGFDLAIYKAESGVWIFAVKAAVFISFGYVYMHLNMLHRQAIRDECALEEGAHKTQ